MPRNPNQPVMSAIKKVQAAIAEEILACLYAFGKHDERPPTDPNKNTITLLMPKMHYTIVGYVNSLTEASDALEKLRQRMEVHERQFIRGDDFPATKLYSERELSAMLAKLQASTTN